MRVYITSIYWRSGRTCGVGGQNITKRTGSPNIPARQTTGVSITPLSGNLNTHTCNSLTETGSSRPRYWCSSPAIAQYPSTLRSNTLRSNTPRTLFNIWRALVCDIGTRPTPRESNPCSNSEDKSPPKLADRKSAN